MEIGLRGNENWFELAGVRVIDGSSYRESTVLTIQQVSISKLDSDPKS